MITAVDCSIVRFDRSVMLPEFFIYYSQSKAYLNDVEAVCSGTTRKRISRKNLGNIVTPTPPLEEQKRIVAVLDAAFEGLDRARAHTEANLQNARDLFESIRKFTLTQGSEDWRQCLLDDVCLVDRGSSPRPIKKYRTDSKDGVNWVKIGDTKVGSKYVTGTKERITREGAEKSRKVEVGDFILTNSMTYGRPYIMKIEGYIHDGWFVLRLADDINGDYFFHLLSSEVVQEQFRELAAGAVVKNISGDLVKKTKLSIPPLDEQEKISALLDKRSQKIDDVNAHYQSKLTDLEELRQSLLQKAFAGELT